ncbi:7-cyano-7-deazaguanine synthase [Methylocella sp.]|uniref:7-cyano-7-deazaguanine synthase n=1 Tax=Methylocella sp. TaxID=1978226 RepID=UPI0035B23FDB
MTVHAYSPRIPTHAIDVVEAGGRPRKGRRAFDLGRDLKFSTAALESYAFARWEPLIYDVMMLAASVEYADRSTRRPSLGWTRTLTLRLPVHAPQRWGASDVTDSLHEALRFLTGDMWTIEFVQRRDDAPSPTQESLQLPVKTRAVIAYSEGMDSRAVAGLMAASLGEELVRVRVGPKAVGLPGKADREPFATVPYTVSARGESSARSRGFKFALISGIAAYLTDAAEIIVPESGQGAFGPALITAAHAYADYRNHPLFMKRMERFLAALFARPFQFSAPRLWHTKGETLKAYAALPGGEAWRDTKSCWRGAQWSALNGKLTQCGICAACMLRRMSVHAAGLQEPEGTYVCDDLTAGTLDAAVHKDFRRVNRAFREYAIAGTLHLDHLADMAAAGNRGAVERHAIITAPSLGMTANEVEALLGGVLERHATEWGLFIKNAGARSFLRQWTR